MTGMIFDIQKFSIHDGPGIRTTVFLKGCPLSCKWCHNPESSVSAQPQLSFTPSRCIGCGACFQACVNDAHQMAGQDHTLLRDVCVVCGACAETCYADALEIVGHEATVDEVIEEVLKDKPFYETSGGGMTLSGGEPLAQIDFTEALLVRAKSEGLHCCIETSSFAPFAHMERLLPHIDIWLCDLKAMNSRLHEEATGVPNEQILENVRKLHAAGADMFLRLPIIPGYNDTEEHFAAVAEFAAALPNIQGLEIMPYHRLGEGKLDRLGLGNLERTKGEQPEPETVKAWVEGLRARGAIVVNEV
ncbi:MAG: glycyl-radical enzyme activating protein [Lentisphaeria bacterium]|nr:glycyl-radical enzyme activating protein [Lentisphaeria bacterium]